MPYLLPSGRWPRAALRLTRRRCLAALGLAPLLVRAEAAWAAWPGKPIRLVVPVPAGGAVDVLVRALGEALAVELGQPVLADNIPGAGGLIAAKAVARATSDGHTLLLVHSGMVAVQVLNPRLDLLRELVPLARLVHSPLALVVRADVPYKTLAELIAAVRAQPGQFAFGSGGIGSPAHVAVLEIASRAGPFAAVHIPYNGAAEAGTALLRGDIEFQFGVLGAVLPMVVAGRFRALAVTGATRSALLPEVPTVAEAGLPGFRIEPWAGLAAPAGTPAGIVARWGDLLPRVLAGPTVQPVVVRLGLVSAYADGPELARQIARELVQEAARARQLGLVAVS